MRAGKLIELDLDESVSDADVEAMCRNQPDLHDGPLRRPWFAGADQAAGGHARADGQAVGRDHRNADHLELQGRPDRPRIFQLDPRRPQGPRRHRAQDRELGLSDPPSGRRVAGCGHHRRGLRDRPRARDARDHPGRRDDRFARRTHPRPHHRRGRGRCQDRRGDHSRRAACSTRRWSPGSRRSACRA